MMTHDIVDTLTSKGSFTSLVAAIKGAGMTDLLKGSGPFTVFAPTDEAFAGLSPDMIGDMLKPEAKTKLAEVLKYHAVHGKVMSADVAGKKMSPGTTAGSSLDIDASGTPVKVNNAKIVTPDIDCSNGVIHIIDKVLLPV
jgi:uncharacterized surface protein with fasciclin (FAS1) repeats